MIAFLVALLLIGSRPTESPEILLDARVPWRSASVEYLEAPIAGDRLFERGVGAVEIEYRMPRAGIDAVLVGAGQAYRAALPPSEKWAKVQLPFQAFGAPPDLRVRSVRFESLDPSIEEKKAIEVRRVSFLSTREAAPGRGAARAAAPPRDGVAVSGGRLFADREPLFAFGLFLLAGNRSVMERLGLAGANAVVEYGPAAWPFAITEDHLDYAGCAGVRVVAALTGEMHGRVSTADRRLAPLGRHPDLLAWYLFDEPDGGAARGHDPAVYSVEALRERRGALGDAPVLLTCLDSFGLARYAPAADVLATDLYWPACGPDRSAALISSQAEATVEIAEPRGALPAIVLQLADPAWAAAGRVTTPDAMRAQALAALAAGVRGIFFFQGVAALRLAEEGHPDAKLWEAFLALSSEMATLGPLAARWARVPGEPELEPALGEVRAACFEESGERWLVCVNLGSAAADVRLGGSCLAGASALVDPRDGWRAEVRGGEWSDRLEPFGGRVVRIVTPDDPPRRRARVEAILQPPGPNEGRLLRYDRAVLGATLYPAPAGAISFAVDGMDRSAETVVHRGAAAVVRLPVRGLASGPHTAALSWSDGGPAVEQVWEFQVEAVALPFEDRFEREVLGDGWAAVDGVRWDPFDPRARPAEGSVGLEGGALVVRSTGGPIGAILRRFEAPEELTLSFEVRMRERGEVLVQRNELFCIVRVPAGRHSVAFHETPAEQRAFVDGKPAGRWTPSLDHRGGVVALGVAAGGEARFDDFRIEAP